MEINLNAYTGSMSISSLGGLSSFNTDTTLHTGTPTSHTYLYYGKGEIVKTDIYEDRIEVVYKCEPCIHTYPGNNYPKIYKEIYSRTDGTIQKIEGKYIPEQNIEESYEF